MSLVLCTLSDPNIRQLLAHPPLIWKVVSPDDPAPYQNELRARTGLLARLFGRTPARPAAHPDLELAENEVVEADLDKAWHGIHYLLTGTAWEGEEPLNFLVNGGEEVGDIEVGIGPARALTSDQVRPIHDALTAIDETALRGRFKPVEMMELEIYPEIWDRDPAEDDTLGYCMEHFAMLKEFVADAVRRESGLVLYLT